MYERKIKSFLQCFGVGDSYLGFHFCTYSIELATENPEWLHSVTKSIYPEVAKKFRTNCGCVERNIRTVAEVVWETGGREFFERMTGHSAPARRPANSKFLELLTDYVLSGDEVNLVDGDWPDGCKSLYDYRQRMILLDRENRELQRTIDRMKDRIGALVRELEAYRKSEDEQGGGMDE